MRDTFCCTAVVDGIPVVPQEKREKLMGVLRKIFGGVGDIRDDGIYMPMNKEGTESLGFCFIEYDSPDMAHRAVAGINGYALDKKHTFRVNQFEDLEKFSRVSRPRPRYRENKGH